MKKQSVGILVLLLLCIGCGREDPSIPDGLITEISISCESHSRTFTSQNSMAAIVRYLRLVPLYDAAPGSQPPETLPVYTVTMTHLSGRRTCYRQAGDSWLSKNGSTWHSLDPSQGQQLSVLFRSLPP